MARVDKYALEEGMQRSLERLWQQLGPLGNILRTLSTGRAMDWETAYAVAADLVRAFGGEVLTRRKTDDAYQRGLEAAIEVITDAGFEVQPSAEPEAPPPPPAVSPLQPKTAPGKTEEDERAEWSDWTVVGDKSSNVWSFRYHFPSSTLEVTYKAPIVQGLRMRRGSSATEPGARGAKIVGKRDAPGAAYWYSDVPVRVYRLLLSASSPGGAVWDHLRVRGTLYGHQYKYRLASGSLVTTQGGAMGVYVPRRATRRGFRTRALAQRGTGRRGFIRSTLPEAVDRGAPDRGVPDRGFQER